MVYPFEPFQRRFAGYTAADSLFGAMYRGVHVRSVLMTFVATFFILLAFWTFMSGLFDIWHFSLGILSSALVAYMSSDLLFKKTGRRRIMSREFRAFAAYIPWLLYRICLANIYVVRVALSRDLSNRIFPHIVKFRTKLKSEMAITTFANSITLTPGTITVHIEGEYFYVHSLDIPLADSLPGEMEKRIAEIYGEV
jgi:multicomponent Na+:H+ antiporter subunit E